MKIILSRKGFDSAGGGVPSPILPTGQGQEFVLDTRQYPEALPWLAGLFVG